MNKQYDHKYNIDEKENMSCDARELKEEDVRTLLSREMWYAPNYLQTFTTNLCKKTNIPSLTKLKSCSLFHYKKQEYVVYKSPNFAIINTETLKHSSG